MRANRTTLVTALLSVLATAPAVSLIGCDPKPAIVLPSPTVQVATVSQQDVPVYKEWIGTLDGSVNADIRAQVTGYILSKNYDEGRLVKKGDLLFQIDPRPFEATLNQAKGILSQAQAQYGKTQLDVKRYTPLAKEGAVSQQDLDNATQNNAAAQATVEADTAQVEKAQLELAFTKIVSPVDGIAGLAKAQVGDLVGPTTGSLTTVSSIDPIKVLFTVSEQEYMAFRDRMTSRPSAQAYLEQLELTLIFPNGQTYPQPGRLFAANRQVDSATGTLQMVGEFSNASDVLRPGQFVRVRAMVNHRKGAMLVPQRAVAELQSMYQVATVDDENTVKMHAVTVGERVGPSWVILDGLRPGDRVVVEGIQKIHPGMTVDVKPWEPVATTQPVPAAAAAQ